MEFVLDAFIDALKIWPLLVIVYVVFEFMGNQRTTYLKNHRLGPVLGAIGGCIPQCGASVAASSLYAAGSITLGTLLSVFISTSDEAIPLMLTYRDQGAFIILLLVVKMIYAILIGSFVDNVFDVKPKRNTYSLLKCSKACDCHESNIVMSAIRRSLKVVVFLFIMTCLMNVVIWVIGENVLEQWLLRAYKWQPFISAAIGLVPNCVSSILITQLYLEGMISFGAVVAGLCTGAGAGLLVLFKENRPISENLKIVCVLYVLSVVIGVILNCLVILS